MQGQEIIVMLVMFWLIIIIIAIRHCKKGPCASSSDQEETESTRNDQTRTFPVPNCYTTEGVANVFYVSSTVDQQNINFTSNMNSQSIFNERNQAVPTDRLTIDDLPPSYEESVRHMK